MIPITVSLEGNRKQSKTNRETIMYTVVQPVWNMLNMTRSLILILGNLENRSSNAQGSKEVTKPIWSISNFAAILDFLGPFGYK